MAEALPSTLVLFVTATAVSTAVGLAIGLRMSRRPGGAFDRLAVTATMFFFGTPAWWVASFSVMFFVYRLGWFPFGALHSVPRPAGAAARLLDTASYLVLPAVTTQAAMLLVDSLCGDFLVERVFARPGLGTLLWQAIQSNEITLAVGDRRVALRAARPISRAWRPCGGSPASRPGGRRRAPRARSRP